MDQWCFDATLVAAWKPGKFTPYLGARLSYAELSIHGDVTSVRDGLTWVTHSEYTAANRDKWGALAAGGLEPGPACKVTSWWTWP